MLLVFFSVLQKHVWCRPKPQGELRVNVHSFLPDLKEKSHLFVCTQLIRDEQEAFLEQNNDHEKVETHSGDIPLMLIS